MKETGKETEESRRPNKTISEDIVLKEVYEVINKIFIANDELTKKLLQRIKIPRWVN